MCGLNGQFTPINNPVNHDDTMELTKKIANLSTHRGPDEFGIWSDPSICYMGFRRLSIIDLSENGNQPMTTSDGNYCLVFNGELYNFKEIRDELIQKGFNFRSSGDSEVVLQSIICWGQNAFKKFNGMFSIVFYNKKERSLLIARDPMGIKPIYYMDTPFGIVFGSDFHQLISHPFAKNLSTSMKGLSYYISYGFIPAPYSIFEKIKMLEMGHFIYVNSSGDIKKQNYYSYSRNPQPDLSGKEAIEAVDEAVTNSIKRQLVSDVPVGTFLSGGIDSPLVVSKISEILSDKINCYTIGVPSDPNDETELAKKYAEEIDCNHMIQNFTQEDIIKYLDKTVTACTEPMADISIFPTLMVSEFAHKDLKVILSGDGGDELFWGYSDRFGHILQKCTDFKVPKLGRNIMWAMKKYMNIGKGYWNMRLNNIGEWYHLKHCFIPDNLKNKLFPDLSYSENLHPYFHYQGHELKETANWMRWNEINFHLQRVLLKVDRASMFNSLEVRVPLLDLELVELSQRIDWNTCLDLNQLQGKIPLRKSLSNHVKFQSKDKMGFSIPMNNWIKTSLKSTIQDELFNKKEFLGLPFNNKRIRKIYKEHLSNNTDYSRVFWSLLHLNFWEKAYIKKKLI